MEKYVVEDFAEAMNLSSSKEFNKKEEFKKKFKNKKSEKTDTAKPDEEKK